MCQSTNASHGLRIFYVSHVKRHDSAGKYGHIETTRNADTIDEKFIYLCCDKLCADIWVWFYSIADRLMSKWFLLDAKSNDN